VHLGLRKILLDCSLHFFKSTFVLFFVINFNNQFNKNFTKLCFDVWSKNSFFKTKNIKWLDENKILIDKSLIVREKYRGSVILKVKKRKFTQYIINDIKS
jgi:hypothetical protein